MYGFPGASGSELPTTAYALLGLALALVLYISEQRKMTREKRFWLRTALMLLIAYCAFKVVMYFALIIIALLIIMLESGADFSSVVQGKKGKEKKRKK